MNSFYSHQELVQLGFAELGEDVSISRKCSIYGAGGMRIGSHVRIDDNCILSGKIEIGNYIHIAAYSAIYGGRKGVTISDFANISSRVCIYALSDDYSGETMTNPMVPDIYKHVDHGHVEIGRHCIIGTCSTVLPHVTIGEGCAFGAYSFINSDCEAWGVYAGIPSRFIKERKRDLLIYERDFLNNVNGENANEENTN